MAFLHFNYFQGGLVKFYPFPDDTFQNKPHTIYSFWDNCMAKNND